MNDTKTTGSGASLSANNKADAKKPSPVDFQSLSNDAHIRETGLIPAVIPVSRGTLWRWVKKKQFPAPVKLSAGVTAWRVGDVRAFLASKA